MDESCFNQGKKGELLLCWRHFVIAVTLRYPFIHQHLFLQIEYFCGGKQPKFKVYGPQGFSFKELPGIKICDCLIDVQHFMLLVELKFDM